MHVINKIFEALWIILKLYILSNLDFEVQLRSRIVNGVSELLLSTYNLTENPITKVFLKNAFK